MSSVYNAVYRVPAVASPSRCQAAHTIRLHTCTVPRFGRTVFWSYLGSILIMNSIEPKYGARLHFSFCNLDIYTMYFTV